MTKSLKLPKSISNIMDNLGFDPKAPKSTQVAFLKYIASQMKVKKFGYETKKENKKQKTTKTNILDIKHAYKQKSLFEEENSKKKTS